MEDNSITGSWPILQYADGVWTGTNDEIAEEKPLTIKLDGQEFATIVCSPSDWDDLLYGFLASEGVILTAADVATVDWNEDIGMASVSLKRKMSLAEADFGKRVIGSCCGKSRQFYLRADAKTAKTSMSRVTVAPEECLAVMAELQLSSGVFARTGGVHNAALYVPGTAAGEGGGESSEGRDGLAAGSGHAGRDDGSKPVTGSPIGIGNGHAGGEGGTGQSAARTGGLLSAVRTDIGRHNALDKLYGHCIRNGISGRDKAIVFSGRLSSEVVLKTAKIGAAILIAKSAPTALALRLAHDLGITAVGFVRHRRFNVYTHAQRIASVPECTKM